MGDALADQPAQDQTGRQPDAGCRDHEPKVGLLVPLRRFGRPSGQGLDLLDQRRHLVRHFGLPLGQYGETVDGLVPPSFLEQEKHPLGDAGMETERQADFVKHAEDGPQGRPAGLVGIDAKGFRRLVDGRAQAVLGFSREVSVVGAGCGKDPVLVGAGEIGRDSGAQGPLQDGGAFQVGNRYVVQRADQRQVLIAESADLRCHPGHRNDRDTSDRQGREEPQ